MSELHHSERGVWSTGVFPGRADLLLNALYDDEKYVMLKCGAPDLGWHVVPVSIHDEPPRARKVRGLSFELLVSTSEAREIGPLMRSSHDGSLECYVLKGEPSSAFRPTVQALQHKAFWDGMGLALAIRLPHEGEMAWVATTSERTLRKFIVRWNSREDSA